jgi:hypothetical protein
VTNAYRHGGGRAAPIHLVEVLTGRKVVNYQSQILFEPHIVMEVFFFADDADGGDARDSASLTNP